jgi:cellulose synthase/poly-beta-1,6-N-acetylglucosamine synthase-like glycosyltransferase
MPPVSAILPSFNEENDIVETIQSILNSDYANLQLFVVNDGSDDNTMELLLEAFDLTSTYPIIMQKIKTVAKIKNYYISKKYPNLTIIDKEHSGKSDSLNIGINACSTPLYISIDADTIIEPDAISRLVFSMISKPHTIAEGGAVYILNGCEHKDGVLIKRKMSLSPLVAMQTCEYLRAFLFGRTGWNQFNGPLILSGAITLFERQAVIDIGGYLRDSPGEDMEVVVGLHEHMRKNNFPYRIGFVFSAPAWTHIPTNMNSLWAQRDRWHRGLIDSLLRHKKMFFNPQYGATGLITYPFQFLAEFLGPIIEFIGYAAIIIGMYLNVIDWHFAVLFFIVTWGFATIITLGTMLISIVSFNKYNRISDIILLFFLVIFESLGYRQIISLCRVVATFRYFIMKLLPF